MGIRILLCWRTPLLARANQFHPSAVEDRGGLHSAIQSLAAVFLILLFLRCACAKPALGQATDTDDQKSSVRGTVVNAVTHEPIGRALVSSPGDRMAMLTDAEGHFEFALPKSEDGPGAGPGQHMRPGPHATVWLTAKKPGFLDRPNEAGDVRAIPGMDVTISLIPEAVIKGRVLLSTGDPAAGIEVQIFSRQVQEGALRWILGGQSRANSNGEFRFAELSPGSYKVVTRELRDDDPADMVAGSQVYGFAPVYYAGVPDFASAAVIQLTAGQVFQADLSLVRQPYFPVNIPVANGQGNGMLRVMVGVQGHRGPEYSLSYNAGKQKIEGLLPNGNYTVEASSFGPGSATGAVNIAVAGVPVEGPNLVLMRNGSVHLQVTEDFTDTNSTTSGSPSNSVRTYGPRSYLHIRAEAADDFATQQNGSLRPPTGPGDESLVIDDLSPGRYWLRISSSRGYVAAATMGGIDLLHQPFTVVSGSSTPIEITMRDDVAQIDGTVTDLSSLSSASPGANTQAYLYCVPLPDSSGQFEHLSVSADGTFHSQNMTPGTYRVMAFKTPQGNIPYRDADAMRIYDSAGQVVRLSPGQKTSVQLQLNSNE